MVKFYRMNIRSHRIWCLPVVLALLSCLVAPLAARAEPMSADAVGRVIENALTAPGAAWAHADGNAPRSGARGTSADGTTITPDSPFLWGSVSKPVAGLVTARLVCAGRLNLDDPVVGLVPSYQPTDPRARNITVRQLLDHTSGIAPLLDQLDDPARDRSLDRAVAAVAGVALVDDPGRQHHYSSANYLVLQAVLQRVSGSDYATLVSAELRSRNSGGLTTRARTESLVGGHTYVVGVTVRAASGHDELGLAYGYLGGSARQLALIGRSVAAELAHPGAGCSPAKLATTASTRLANGDGYGLGWRISTWNGQRVLWHAGAVSGYATFFAVLPDSGDVVAVLQNAYGPLHDERLLTPGVDAVRTLVGQAPVGVHQPVAYWAALVTMAVAMVLLGIGVVRAPRGRAGAIVRLAVGGALIAVVALVPRLAGLGSWRVAWLWLPDLTAGCLVIGLASLALTVRAVRFVISARR